MANTIREFILRSVSPILFGFGDSCDIASELIIELLQMKASHNQGVEARKAFFLLRPKTPDPSDKTKYRSLLNGNDI